MQIGPRAPRDRCFQGHRTHKDLSRVALPAPSVPRQFRRALLDIPSLGRERYAVVEPLASNTLRALRNAPRVKECAELVSHGDALHILTRAANHLALRAKARFLDRTAFEHRNGNRLHPL